MNDGPAWRRMEPADIDGVIDLADRIHPDLPEPPEMFADRLRIWPRGALILDHAGTLSGYAIGHPVKFPDVPNLGTILGDLPDDADAFYVHDIAIAPDMRGRALADAALVMLLKGASGLARACLIAVYGTSALWQRHGFEPAPDAIAPEKLATYGDDAVFMVRPLSNI